MLISPTLDIPGPLLRQQFVLEQGHGDVSSATLHLSALGVCEAWINGQPVSADVLSPGWTAYERRVRVVEHEVSALLAPDFALVIALGNGWYRGRLGWCGDRALYGDRLGAYAQLIITFADGHTQTVGTDPTWIAKPGPTVVDDLYDGQTIDARRRDDDWFLPGATADDAVSVEEIAGAHLLVHQQHSPTRRLAELPPVAITRSPSGQTLIDFGENLVGWVRLECEGPRDTEIVLRYAEVLERGELGTRPLRAAKATDRFILSGAVDTFEPTFTFHGFRYVQIDGWPGELADLERAITAVVVGADLPRRGHFRCSDDRLNQLHDNVIRSMRGNFLAVPTDCPQRDERLGWTGDIAVFAPTAAFLSDSRTFLSEWLRDVAIEQEYGQGVVPHVVPDILKFIEVIDPVLPKETESTAIWSDAVVWVPWALWKAYGDRGLLEEQYEAALTHVRHVSTLLSPSGLWDNGFQFGDWLDPDAPPDTPAAAKAHPGVVATACAFRSATFVADMARTLDRPGDLAELSDLAARIRTAFNDHYVEQGQVKSDCTTVYSLAICFGLLDEGDQHTAGARLAELVEHSGFLISTGFAGTPFICDALTITGHVDAAYRLLLQTNCPSWLYPVTMGATTIWERWDSMLPDGDINPGEMTSFNHYALGAVADWMHRTIGGLCPLTPGYEQILIAPQPGGNLTSASTALETALGTVSVEWTIADGSLTIDASVPEGCSALLQLPGETTPEPVGSGTLRRSIAWA